MNSTDKSIDKRFLKAIVSKAKSDLLFTPPQAFNTSTKAKNIVWQAYVYWSNLAQARQDRRRAREYLTGNQFIELIPDEDNPSFLITEKEFLEKKGQPALIQNVLLPLVNNMVGQYRSNPSKSTVVSRSRENASLSDMLTNALQSALDLNENKGLDAECMMEFVLSGFVCQKTRYQYWPSRHQSNLYLEKVAFNRMFFNTDLKDRRMHDLKMIGQIHDYTIDEVIKAYAKNKADEIELRRIFSSSTKTNVYAEYSGYGLDTSMIDAVDFMMPYDNNKCRVIEVWVKESRWTIWAHDWANGTWGPSSLTEEQIKEENYRRMANGIEAGYDKKDIAYIDYKPKVEDYWKTYHMTVYGHILLEKESVFSHKEHPYAIRLYPLLDGKIWGLVSAVIDQQRYINRLVKLMDMILGTSAKNLFLVPETAIPEGMDISDFADEYSKIGGVIKYKPKQGVDIPSVISSNSVTPGATEMLAQQMNFLTQIAGISPAMQGQEPKAGTPGSLYITQVQQSSMNTRDIMEVFQEFIKTRDYKALNVIKQFHKTGQYIGSSGKRFQPEADYWDAEKLRHVDADINVAQGVDTPIYRAMIDDVLMKLLDSQHIDITMFLENTSLPFAEKLLQQIKAKISQQQPPPDAQLNPEEQAMLAQQANQVNKQADPRTMQVMDQMLAV